MSFSFNLYKPSIRIPEPTLSVFLYKSKQPDPIIHLKPEISNLLAEIRFLDNEGT